MYNFNLMSETADTLGLTNRDIANSASLSESTVSRYMSGSVKEPAFEVIADICNVLHLSLDVVAGREAMVELPLKEGEHLTENLIIIRDFVRRNFERLRTVEHEKDAAFNRHIDHMKEQLDKYSAQFKKYNIAIFSLIGLCALLVGMMVMMVVNNRALQSQVRDLQDNLAAYHEYMPEDDLTAE